METTIRPFLMFEGNAQEAIDLYLSLFPNSEVIDIIRYGAGQAGPEGTIQKAVFRLGDQTVLCTDSFIQHAFTFTPSFSFFVECAALEELTHLFSQLSHSGNVLMPLADYGFSRSFAWVSDRFGVSWQLNLA